MSDDHSRGRAPALASPIVSTGRGGAGNLIRSPSRGVDPEVIPGAERGREITPHDTLGDRVTHSGRGGAGNIRSPSRGPANAAYEAKEDALQERLIAESRGRQADAPFSSGRGGVGNISKSRSRSRSQARHEGSIDSSRTHSPSLKHDYGVGRGGYGNIKEQRESEDLGKLAAEQRYEQEVLNKHRVTEEGHPVSVGKGGSGNIGQHLTPVDMSNLTLEEQEAYAKVHANDKAGFSTGKGGAGNYYTPPSSKDHSPDGERGRGDHHKGGMLGNVLRSLSRAKGKDGNKD